MGMPSLTTGDVARNFLQDGGHRMEALRQMGHGDTKVPVMRIVKKAFPAKFANNCRECGTYLPVGEMVNMGKDGGIVCRNAPRCGMKYVV